MVAGEVVVEPSSMGSLLMQVKFGDSSAMVVGVLAGFIGESEVCTGSVCLFKLLSSRSEAL